MKTCHKIESNILKNNINDEILNHLKTCDDCRLYYELLNTETIDSPIPTETIDLAVASAINNAEIKQRKSNKVSLIVFMCLAAALLITAYAITNDSLVIFIRRYLLIVSSIMPFTLPIIGIIRRKVVIK